MNQEKEQFVTFKDIVRDFFVNLMPFKLSNSNVERLYGFSPDFIFLTHPRNRADIYNIAPVLKIIRKFIPEQIIFKILSLCPAYVVSVVDWQGKIKGFIISTPALPEELFDKRTKTLSIAANIISFIRKISYKKVYVGLAAWWPIVTNNGLAFRRFLKENDKIVVTNGHTATLVSIYLTIDRIAAVTGKKLKDLELAILGVGRMGTAVANVFNGKIKRIGLLDKNKSRLEIIAGNLRNKQQSSAIEEYIIDENKRDVGNVPSLLSNFDITVCTTSNTRYICEDSNLLRDCVIIDDARPEAFVRVIDPQRRIVVLEGGLIKIKDIKVSYDFGFGQVDSVFGCMAEAIILAMDNHGRILPTLGEIDYDNFNAMLDFCRDAGLREGDLLAGRVVVSESDLLKIL